MGTAPRSLSLEAAGSGCVQSRGLESSKGIQMARGRRCPWRDTGQAHREEAKPQAASLTRGGERPRMPPQLEKNHVVPTAWQEEALARDGVSREVPCSALTAELQLCAQAR